MIKKHILFLTLVIASSCQSEKISNPITIDVYTEEDKILKSSSFSNRVSYIALEQPKGSNIGDVKKIRFINGCAIVLDGKLSRLLKYNSKGELLAISNNFGRGPLEVTRVVDFYVDSVNACIKALDVSGYKIVVYDSLLNPLRKLGVKVRGERNFFKLSSNEYLLYADNYPFIQGLHQAVYIVDTLGRIISSYADNSDFLYISSPERNSINENGKKIFFNRGHTYEINEFDSETNSCEIKYLVNFKNFTFPRKILDEYKRINEKGTIYNEFLLKFIEVANSGKYVYGIKDLYVNGNYLLFRYQLTTTPNNFIVVYNNAKNIMLTGKPINDLSPIADFGKPVCMQGNKLYTVLYNEDSDTYQIAIYDLKE